MSDVRVDVDGNVAEIVLDRPPVNAFSQGFYESVAGVFGDVSNDAGIDVVLLRSANERVFSAGADLRDHLRAIEGGRADHDEQRQLAARELTGAIMHCAQPTIAVIDGPALGAGAVVAVSCDIRYASAKATIGLPEINVVRTGGATQLKRLLPQGILRELYLSGEPLAADDALRYGVFNRVFADGGEALDRARELTRRIGAKSPLSLRAFKRVLNEIEFLPHDESYPLEQAEAIRLAKTPDALEAVQAFLEKRPPTWTR